MSERITKLTKRVVVVAQPEDERYVIWDSALKGFGLRVEASGTKTFLVRYRVCGGKRFLNCAQISSERWRDWRARDAALFDRDRNPQRLE